MSLQVLLVTADDANTARITRTLERPQPGGTRFDVERALTLAEATATLRRLRPDIILLNLALPDSAGLATFDGIAAVAPTVPIVLLSASEDDLLARAAVRRGAAAFFSLASSGSELVPQMLLQVIQHAHARARLAHHQRRSAATLQSMADAVIVTAEDGCVEFANYAALRLLACPKSIHGRPVEGLMTLLRHEDRVPIQHPVRQALALRQSVRLPPGTVLVRSDGSEVMIADCSSPIVDEHGLVKGAVMVFHDITEAFELRSQVEFLAWHDSLTGLPNRLAMQRRLQELLGGLRPAESFAVLYLDLDNFKWVNDSLGHSAGDSLLVEVAHRLRACLRDGDIVSRQGGDEFVMLMAAPADAEDAARLAERVLHAFSAPFLVDGATLHTGCSIGLALAPEHGRSDEVLLRHADAALHSAKAAGRRTWRPFTEELHTRALRRRELEDGLRHAIDLDGLALHFQPKVDLHRGSCCGAEALLRWFHPEWGQVNTEALIRCAEETGVIVQLGRWVVARACAQLRAWELAGVPRVPLAINVSAHELRQPDFVDHLLYHLDLCQLEPSALQLEITESALIRDQGPSARALARLKDHGISLAIDDFGTGYSSLSYLAELPIDALKLDRSFVHGIHCAAPRRQGIVQAVLTLAQHLNLHVVAEGVETELEASFLSQVRCDQGQGYLYSRPLDAARFERYLQSVPLTPGCR